MVMPVTMSVESVLWAVLMAGPEKDVDKVSTCMTLRKYTVICCAVKFQLKILILFMFLFKNIDCVYNLDEAVLTSTHNLRFWKYRYTLLHPYIKMVCIRGYLFLGHFS